MQRSLTWLKRASAAVIARLHEPVDISYHQGGARDGIPLCRVYPWHLVRFLEGGDSNDEVGLLWLRAVTASEIQGLQGPVDVLISQGGAKTGLILCRLIPWPLYMEGDDNKVEENESPLSRLWGRGEERY